MVGRFAEDVVCSSVCDIYRVPSARYDENLYREGRSPLLFAPLLSPFPTLDRTHHKRGNRMIDRSFEGFHSLSGKGCNGLLFEGRVGLSAG